MELLAPAGNYEKMVAAIVFGADAVYFGGPAFSLRAFAGNFSFDEMNEALKYLHERGKKGFITVNIFPNTHELDSIAAYLKELNKLNPDGLIVSDAGVFDIIRKENIKIPVSISTQSNITNVSALNFWADNGASRVILAREISREDLAATVKKAKCEVEVFIHGAICISMSGRCLISSYMTNRSANRGECTHPCRWNYALMEETRQNEYFPIEEDSRGTYFYNSKDLCLIDRISELVQMGVHSGKIEGRMKSVLYVSVVAGVYRAALDRAMASPLDYKSDDKWHMLLNCISNRGYTEGFYSGVQDSAAMNNETGGYRRDADFLGVVESSSISELKIVAKSKFFPDETITLLEPNLKMTEFKPNLIYDERDVPVENTRPGYRYKINCAAKAESGAVLMRMH